jgi:hypothetical protein
VRFASGWELAFRGLRVRLRHGAFPPLPRRLRVAVCLPLVTLAGKVPSNETPPLGTARTHGQMMRSLQHLPLPRMAGRRLSSPARVLASGAKLCTKPEAIADA